MNCKVILYYKYAIKYIQGIYNGKKCFGTVL